MFKRTFIKVGGMENFYKGRMEEGVSVNMKFWFECLKMFCKCWTL